MRYPAIITKEGKKTDPCAINRARASMVLRAVPECARWLERPRPREPRLGRGTFLHSSRHTLPWTSEGSRQRVWLRATPPPSDLHQHRLGRARCVVESPLGLALFAP